MKKLPLSLCLSFLLLTSLSAIAGWNDDNTGTIIQNVKEIKKEVIGSDGKLKQVTDEFRQQLQDLNDRGLILRESFDDFLTWLKAREGPYREFVGPAGTTRCGPGTVCSQFRTDLNQFFTELGEQRANFPAINKVGLGDGSNAITIVNNSPPIMLFGLYEVMNRIPDWQKVPADLQSIFDEIGDPDVFSVRLQEDEGNGAMLNLASNAMFASRSPTQRFCSRWEKRVDNALDPIRMNRIEFYVFYIRQFLGTWEALTSPTIGGGAAGFENETLVPNPLKAQLKLLTTAFDVIQKGAQTFRDNLGVCRAKRRELELQVAQCLQLADFVMPGMRDDVYFLVETKIENAESESVPVGNSRGLLNRAERQRRQGRWRDAYFSLCDSYQRIGEK